MPHLRTLSQKKGENEIHSNASNAFSARFAGVFWVRRCRKKQKSQTISPGRFSASANANILPAMSVLTLCSLQTMLRLFRCVRHLQPGQSATFIRRAAPACWPGRRTGEWEGKVEEIKAGDVIWCPPKVKHWHGASPTTAMTHIAITGTVNGKNVEWMEKVTDEQYNRK
jgi:hypothetical protein